MQNLKMSLNATQQSNDQKILGLKERIVYLTKYHNCKESEIKKIKKQIKYLYQSAKQKYNSEDDIDEKQMSQIEKIRNWINDSVKLPQYFQLFIKHGYDDVSIILDMNNEDLIQIGIDKIGHRKKVMKYIHLLQNTENNNDMQSVFSFSEIEIDSSKQTSVSTESIQMQKLNENFCPTCKSFNFSDALSCKLCDTSL